MEGRGDARSCSELCLWLLVRAKLPPDVGPRGAARRSPRRGPVPGGAARGRGRGRGREPTRGRGRTRRPPGAALPPAPRSVRARSPQRARPPGRDGPCSPRHICTLHPCPLHPCPPRPCPLRPCPPRPRRLLLAPLPGAGRRGARFPPLPRAGRAAPPLGKAPRPSAAPPPVLRETGCGEAGRRSRAVPGAGGPRRSCPRPVRGRPAARGKIPAT